jgi:hypothetical protein
MQRLMRTPGRCLLAAAAYVLLSFVLACATRGKDAVRQHLWWSGFGPVLPHDTFPADCSLCHVGRGWQTLTEGFEFDHEAETGVPLNGAHARASCLRCHNDRGPAGSFARQGCAGCHEDVHRGELGPACTRCHGEQTWRPIGQIELHDRTRFPLTGAHVATSCHRCHPGAEVGVFRPTDTECVSCHRTDLAQAQNPNHIGLGWVDRCDRCHIPTVWQQAEID